MLVQPFSVLAAFVAVLEGLLGLFLLVAVLRRARRRVPRRGVRAHGSEPSADAVPLLGFTAFVLVGLAVASWPLLYLLLDSEVALWPGVMCIQGVLNVGAGSPGASAWLPGLLAALEVTKPALVFLAGLWLLLHLVDRATRTGPLRGVLLATLGVLGAVAVADAAFEFAYLAIPKAAAAAAGCCTLQVLPHDQALGGPLAALRPATARTTLLVTHLLVGLLLVVGTSAWARCLEAPGPYRPPRGAAALGVLAALSLPIGALFLADVAAPALLGRPFHRCPYCVLGEAPETLVGVGLFVLGAFAVGWAALLPALARAPEARAALGRPVRGLVSLGRFGYAAATLFAAVALAIA